MEKKLAISGKVIGLSELQGLTEEGIVNKLKDYGLFVSTERAAKIKDSIEYKPTKIKIMRDIEKQKQNEGKEK